MITYVGIDPGVVGAFAFLDADAKFLRVMDMPTVRLSKKGRVEIDDVGVLEIVRKWMDKEHTMVVLEKVNGMPGQGGPSSFNFGAGWGIIRGVLTALEIPHQLVTPQQWKGVVMVGQPKEKDASRAVARRLFPPAREFLRLKKHDGRADAILMAEYGRRKL